MFSERYINVFNEQLRIPFELYQSTLADSLSSHSSDQIHVENIL